MSQRKCPQCQETLDLSLFRKCNQKYSYCRSCYNAYSRKWRKKNKHKVTKSNRTWRLKQYNINETQYNELLSKQNGVCAICSTPPGVKKLNVDHCHKSGFIRGILCVQCNTAIGLLGDTEELIQKALLYLLEFKERTNGTD